MKSTIVQWMIVFVSLVGMSSSSFGSQDVGNYLTKKMLRYPINKTTRLSTGVISTDRLQVNSSNFIARADCDYPNIKHNFSNTSGSVNAVTCYKLDIPFSSNLGKLGIFDDVSNDFASISWSAYPYLGMKLNFTDHISGFTDKVSAKNNVMQIGTGNEDSDWVIKSGETVEIEGYAIIHAKSLTMEPGSKLYSSRGGAVIILDENMVAKGTASNCDIKNLMSGNTRDASTCVKISGVDIVSRYYDLNLFRGQKAIDLSYVIGEFYPTEELCSNCESYIRNMKEPDEKEYTLVPAMARFAGTQISVSDVLFGDYDLDWDLEDDPQIVNYSVELPATPSVTCEDALITVSSDSDETTSVDVNLEGVGYFTSNGTTKININVSKSKPVTLAVSSKGVGTTSVSLSEPMTCSSNPCSFVFGDLALRFYEDSDSGISPVSKKINFYAGMPQKYYLGIVSAKDEKVCERIRAKNDEMVLKTDSDSHTLVDFSEQNKIIADKTGVSIKLEYNDGYYTVPTLTDNNAGSFGLHADVMLEGDGQASNLSSDIQLATSPYAMYIDFSAQDCSNCHSALGEKFDAGQDLKLSYIPKAWCDGLKTVDAVGDNFVVVSNETLKNCPTTESFYGAKEENVLVYGIEQNSDIKQSVVNYLNHRSVSLKNVGAKLSTVNQIENVGAFKFGIDSFYDSVTELKVNGGILDSVAGYFAPWAFEFKYVPGDTFAVSNSCLNADPDHHSFTYFGQPFPVKLLVYAKTANGNIASLFDNEHYVNANKYNSVFAAVNSSGELLVNSDGTIRLSSCGTECSGIEPQWTDGILDLSNYYMKLYPMGVNELNYGKDSLREYRQELPIYKISESEISKRHSAYFANLIMKISVQTDANIWKDHKIDFENSFNEPSSIYYGINKEFVLGSDKYIRLFGPLDLRMGRILVENERTNNKSSLYMPVKIQYFTKFSNGTQNWITNEDDICTRLGRQNFYVSSYLNASGPSSDLRTSNIVDFGNSVNSKVYLVSERNDSADVNKEIIDGIEDQYAIAKKGLMFLRFTPPKKEEAIVKDQIIFLVHSFTETEHSEGNVPTLLTPLKSYKTNSPVSSYPIWFGISQESKEFAFGAFRAWPGNDRVLYRIDNHY